jgi:hypothetical protein
MMVVVLRPDENIRTSGDISLLSSYGGHGLDNFHRWVYFFHIIVLLLQYCCSASTNITPNFELSWWTCFTQMVDVLHSDGGRASYS